MRPLFLLTCGIAGLVNHVAMADDWPMWRRDAGRTAVAPSELPDSMSLSWARQLPSIRPAFHSARLQFDAGYEPIVAEGRLLIASSKTDSVTAYDIETGAETWVFRTNGPVRLAPAVWKNSVCFGSDDGCLYCVDLATGALQWKHRAVPSQRRLLGNQRLISVWPVRGGPVVADGRVYFAAGVWPFEGVFVYAMDIDSGKVIWRNDQLGYLFGQQPHNTEAIGGLAPQGYLVIHEDKLIVPCSTAYPATLNRDTGELIEFELPGAGRYPGGWFAALDDTMARAIRRGTLTFDDVINSQLHEDKIHKGQGTTGISRRIQAGRQTLNFDDGYDNVEGIVHSMVTAADRLFVTTREGQLYCFAPQSDKVTRWQEPRTTLTISNNARALAQQQTNAAGSHGFAFVVGLKSGESVKALLRESKYHVVAIDDDPDRVARLRRELVESGDYGVRASVIQSNLSDIKLPPYVATLLTSESPEKIAGSTRSLLQALRPFGGTAFMEAGTDNKLTKLKSLEAEGFEFRSSDDMLIARRTGPLPGSTDYNADWQKSPDALVRFPLGVLWFDDTLAHFKRSPQPQFRSGVMISRPKNWHAPRVKGEYKTDYPLLPAVLSDMYTGRVMEESEHPELRSELPKVDAVTPEPSQYRPPRQKDAWKPDQPVAGERINPLTGQKEPRTFPKTYGCDGGVDYGSFYTLRAGTPAFYDKTAESGTVFLSGPRSGCTNSIIPAGGLLNVPYFYEGCTCSYPLPTAMSLIAMPESHEQWSAWGETEISPKSIQRIGLNFGAPGDRITRSGTLWLDYPSVGGPSPKVRIEAIPAKPITRYRHSLWMKGDAEQSWVSASAVEGLERMVVHDLKPGHYTVRLYFAESDNIKSGDRVQNVSIQDNVLLSDFDIVSEVGRQMHEFVHVSHKVKIDGVLTLELSATHGQSLISGIELIWESTSANVDVTSDQSAKIAR